MEKSILFNNYNRLSLLYLIGMAIWIYLSNFIFTALFTDPGYVNTSLKISFGIYGIASAGIFYKMFQQINREKDELDVSLKEKDRQLQIESGKIQEKLIRNFRKAPSPMAILKGENHRYDFVNDAYLKMFNHKRLMGKTVKEALPEVKDQGFIEKLDKVYRTGKPYCNKGKPLRINSGGSVQTFYRDVIYNPLFDMDGNVYGIFIQTNDITDQLNAKKELQKALADKQVLMEELHHRVNNNLSVIIGLLQLQSDEFEEPDIQLALKNTQSRIFTIADIHEYLYKQESLTHIPFNDFILGLPKKIYSLYDSNLPIIKVFAEEKLLNVNQAVSLGLILNELFSYLAQHHAQDIKQITITSNSTDASVINLNVKIRAANCNLNEMTSSEEGLRTTLINLLAEQLQAEMNLSASEISLQFSQNNKNGSFNNLIPDRQAIFSG